MNVYHIHIPATIETTIVRLTKKAPPARARRQIRGRTRSIHWL